ncbi:Dual specificity protein phosphatase (DsPTP1) family protein isoform 1 [Theobroma cacao]|uniref:Dual specificity protein phosphatase (DsPTP1) family protein isoform 1 n=1 Tax=Theobroma cacao TaxID=3641 RepID=A0A061FZ34_THECC|nr:Dual specificity protein phosphatase (DsPTP1) family protein isoform 1 [Theobroma cacao]EOY20064.1 Dual specificity protein phosphatase (DsPTP1) family protein isoform 1 [Theobroma cacao]
MSGINSTSCFSSVFQNLHETELLSAKKKSRLSFMLPRYQFNGGCTGIFCKVSESGIGGNPTNSKVSVRSKNRTEEYNTAMKRMMRNPYEYHHDLGMNYTLITDNLIVGSQPQKPEDIDHLKQEEKVAYILNLQQDKDIEYWGIDLQSIIKRCRQLGIRHMRRPARDFDPDSLRNELPRAVSSLEWAISEGKGKVYVHCTAGLGRAPAVAIAYMFWFCNMNLNTAYDALTSKRPCGPNKIAIRGATYDLAKNDPWKEPFESLPEHAFEGIADWERKLIQDGVRSLRGT